MGARLSVGKTAQRLVNDRRRVNAAFRVLSAANLPLPLPARAQMYRTEGAVPPGAGRLPARRGRGESTAGDVLKADMPEGTPHPAVHERWAPGLVSATRRLLIPVLRVVALSAPGLTRIHVPRDSSRVSRETICCFQ